MQNIKKYLIYVISMIFLLCLFASFETGNLYPHADKLNLQPDRLFLAYSGKTDELSPFKTDEIIEPDNETKAETYALGDNSPFVREYKMKLAYLGHIAYPDSNIFDTLTEEAVKAYQTEHGIEVTGKLDKITMGLLDEVDISYKLGDHDEVIGDYQAMLAKLGYLNEYTVNTFDENTQNAIKAYQTEKAIEVTSMLDLTTKKALTDDISTLDTQAE